MFEAAFALGVLAQSFSGSFAVRFVSVCSVSSCHSDRSDLSVEHWQLSD